MKERQCFRCGKGLSPGSLTYVTHIRIVADFDGVILEPEENIDDQLKQMIEQIQDEDPEELEKEVFEEFTLVLCKSCRDRFVDETRHPWEGSFRIQKGTGGFIQ